MCVTRSWKSIETHEYAGFFLARRSDGVLIQLYNVEFKSIYDFTRKLEEFRNCKCTSAEPCNKHLEEKERLM